MATVAAERALPYAEPSIVTVLVLASFLLVLNAANAILDATVYCGLVGELVVGVLWGTPLGGWLARGVETAVVQLGYLGLILLVYEGIVYVIGRFSARCSVLYEMLSLMPRCMYVARRPEYVAGPIAHQPSAVRRRRPDGNRQPNRPIVCAGPARFCKFIAMLRGRGRALCNLAGDHLHHTIVGRVCQHSPWNGPYQRSDD